MSCRFLVFVILLVFGFIWIIPVGAHPPGNIGLSYDSGTGTLNVTILHPVNGAPDHYIREVTIEIPDKPVQKMEYSSQPGTDEFTYSYPVTIPEGATVKVTAFCSKFGSLSKSIQSEVNTAGVPKATGNTGSVSQGNTAVKPSSTPGFIAAGAVFALICALALLSVRK